MHSLTLREAKLARKRHKPASDVMTTRAKSADRVLGQTKGKDILH